MTGFADQTLRRYSRQILLREVGGRGQRAILSSCVALRVLPGGADIAAVAAQYLLRAGIRQVRWFADAQTDTGPLDALHAIEPDDCGGDDCEPSSQDSDAHTQDDRKPDASSSASQTDQTQVSARLVRGLPADRPAGLSDPPRNALCLAIWTPCAGEPARLWATVDACTIGAAHAPTHAVDPSPTRHASIEAMNASDVIGANAASGANNANGAIEADAADAADALILGSALALGVLQAVLRIPPQVAPFFSLRQG